MVEHHNRTARRYQTDPSGEEWGAIEPCSYPPALGGQKGAGRSRTFSMCMSRFETLEK